MRCLCYSKVFAELREVCKGKVLHSWWLHSWWLQHVQCRAFTVMKQIPVTFTFRTEQKSLSEFEDPKIKLCWGSPEKCDIIRCRNEKESSFKFDVKRKLWQTIEGDVKAGDELTLYLPPANSNGEYENMQKITFDEVDKYRVIHYTTTEAPPVLRKIVDVVVNPRCQKGECCP
eukprot:GHVS01101770.1.p1 GENE.GHVS01101770.1~~GHVS01101770.1.p1  ORF type:complete len:173 (+),score=1.65 GHVS01101770.1:116-634(+)